MTIRMFLHDHPDVPLVLQQRDVGQRVAPDRDHVSQLAAIQRPDVGGHVQGLRRVGGGRLDRLHRGHAVLHVDLQLVCVLAHLGVELRVRPHGDLDARLVDPLERLPGVRLDRLHLVEHELGGPELPPDLDGAVGPVRQGRHEDPAGVLDHRDGLVVGEYAVLDGIHAGPYRHALRFRREAVARAGLLERVGLVGDGVELVLGHVPDVRLFLVRAAAARRAGLDDVAPHPEVRPRQFAQTPGAIGGDARHPERVAGHDQIEVRAGDHGPARDLEAGTGDDPLVDGVAQGDQLVGQLASIADPAEVAQRREAHLEAHLGVEQGVEDLQLGRDLEARHPVVGKGSRVEGAQVQVGVDHARHERAPRHVDDLRVDGQVRLRPSPRSHHPVRR
jgi:hypothetical protein